MAHGTNIDEDRGVFKQTDKGAEDRALCGRQVDTKETSPRGTEEESGHWRQRPQRRSVDHPDIFQASSKVKVKRKRKRKGGANHSSEGDMGAPLLASRKRKEEASSEPKKQSGQTNVKLETNECPDRKRGLTESLSEFDTGLETKGKRRERESKGGQQDGAAKQAEQAYPMEGKPIPTQLQVKAETCRPSGELERGSQMDQGVATPSRRRTADDGSAGATGGDDRNDDSPKVGYGQEVEVTPSPRTRGGQYHVAIWEADEKVMGTPQSHAAHLEAEVPGTDVFEFEVSDI